jgi:hypothetical protein
MLHPTPPNCFCVTHRTRRHLNFPTPLPIDPRIGNLEYLLSQRQARDGMITPFRKTVNNFFVRQHGPERGTPLTDTELCCANPPC